MTDKPKSLKQLILETIQESTICLSIPELSSILKQPTYSIAGSLSVLYKEKNVSRFKDFEIGRFFHYVRIEQKKAFIGSEYRQQLVGNKQKRLTKLSA